MGKQELFIFPCQITLAPDKHSNSQKKFFGGWKEWIKALEEFDDVVLEFLWISPKAAEIKKHVKSHQWPLMLSGTFQSTMSVRGSGTGTMN
jgi:hypothetical protein